MTVPERDNVEFDEEIAILIERFNIDVNLAICRLFCRFCCQNREEGACPLEKYKQQVSQPLKLLL